ncbi:ABC-2 family transporter protein [Kitasatospora sp. GP82]|uniref:ABC transporter permease n=1 Tax=Kitasatospora sp. GP82 TaxID=3035089 RepID=UPI0024765233|nr:ABC-2 family transporter protein [Kitasatospora sp. GP82]MDH6128374.1 ABC-2 type transport system permease protein [Kitasatospora sp. GP82]
MTRAGTVPARLRRYAPFTAASLQGLLQYRATFLINALTAATAVGVQVFLWRAVYAGRSGGMPGGYDLPHLTTYVLLAQVLGLMQANRVDEEVSGEVQRGDIAVSLLRPVSYPLARFAAGLPVSLTNATLVAVPVVVLYALLLPLSVPSPQGALLFGCSAALSLVIGFGVNLLVGLAGFVTTNIWGVRIVKDSVVAFFAGQVVPLALMPGPLAAVAQALPFQGMVDGPLRLLLGRYHGPLEAASILGVQLAWAAALSALAALAWRGAVRRVEVLGG